MTRGERAAAQAGPAAWDCHVHVFEAGAPVAGGHYQPVDRPLAQIEALAEAHDVGHLVLVQPSVYGTDNRVLLDALRRSGGRHRAVVVADGTLQEKAMLAMHALGVRGVRFNLVSPVGNGAAAFQALAPRLRALGWHAQWYARPDDLAAIARAHDDTGVACVLDHLGGMHAALQPHEAAWDAMARLANMGAWIKLSGWYRLRAMAPYDALDGALARVAQMFGTRMVWGSDWPHTAFADGALPPYADLWAPVVRGLGPDAARQARYTAPWRLYR